MTSRLYGEQHRRLQDRFDTRRLADGVEAKVVERTISAESKAFIEGRDMFWLATIDHLGRPTVSYKGGDPGFVRVVDPGTIAFPSYDGNGMFLSMGNIAGNANVGLLFVNLETPRRLRVQGTARIIDGDPLRAEYAAAELIVRVSVSEVFRNCPRYVHRYQKMAPSAFVPKPGATAPLPGWKRIDDVQAELPAKDQGRAAREGKLRTREEHMAMVARGDPEA